MKISYPALLLSGSVFLTGCDMEWSAETKLKAEETAQAAMELKKSATSSVEHLHTSLNNELEKKKDVMQNMAQDVVTSDLSAKASQQIDSVKQQAENIGEMKISELLRAGSSHEAAPDDDDAQ